MLRKFAFVLLRGGAGGTIPSQVCFYASTEINSVEVYSQRSQLINLMFTCNMYNDILISKIYR